MHKMQQTDILGKVFYNKLYVLHQNNNQLIKYLHEYF